MRYAIADIIALHKKYAPSDEIYGLVLTHSQIIYDIALQLIEKEAFPINRELVQTGALLHDIGAYPLFGSNSKLREGISYVSHGIEGEKILKREGFPEAIWRFAAHHTGVGLSKQDIIIQKLPLPIEDYLAESDEELLIMYADKFHSKTTPPYINSFEWCREDLAQYGEDKVIKFDNMAVKFGIPSLKPLSSKYSYTIRDLPLVSSSKQ